MWLRRAAAAARRCQVLRGEVQNHSPTLGQMGLMAPAPEPRGWKGEVMVFVGVRWSWGLCLRSWGHFLAF